jgi:endonuclease YncB( thermonuclease family)
VPDSVVPFRRPRLRHQLWRLNRWRQRWRVSRWLPCLVVVLGAATASWFLPELRSSLSNPAQAIAWAHNVVQRLDGAPGPNLVVLRPRAVGGSDFQLCLGHRLQNCVIDGDTIRYQGVKVRLADIDTPEVFSPKCAYEANLGRQATERLLQLINAGPIELVAGGRDTDRYGRKLRVVTRHGRSLGDTLIAEGLARRWDGARRSWCG